MLPNGHFREFYRHQKIKDFLLGMNFSYLLKYEFILKNFCNLKIFD